MVNFGLSPASFLGILLAVAGAGLYFLRSVRPELSRDQDIAFSAIGILCGFILIFQGWRLDPILQFGQFMISGSAIFFAYENIKLRGIATEQAKENTRIVDDERPVSRRYKAEIEDREYLDERPRNSRRIKRPRRRSVTRELPEERFATEAPPRRRRDESERSAGSSLARRAADSWDGDEEWDESSARNSRRALPDADANPQPQRRSVRREPRDVAPESWNDRNDADRQQMAQEDDRQRDPASRRRRTRSTTNDEQTIASTEGTTANYVDYEPIDDPQAGLPPSGDEPIVFPDRY
jgi:Ycf66 protein N-terminus